MTGPAADSVLEAVGEALAAEARLDRARETIALERDDSGALIMTAELNSVAEKRLALERAAAVAGVASIVDRLRIKPATPMEDKAIREHVCRALDADDGFWNLALVETVEKEDRVFRDAAGEPAGRVAVEVDDGVVILNGAVPSLQHKRLAGVLAWWTPGSRDVVNGIEVEPAEEDGPDRIEEAVRIALDRDPFVDASEVRVGVRGATVRLTGAAADAEQRHMAECDAWYVFGVDDVINAIELTQTPS
ncbi:transporter [Marinicauda salina]|uniref:Transporter n=1 Tax=Marinicauda salina TaxID=2135793 RepID=A0A2U2BWW8_9PROT|nr:BON domain-containing protein [Marinicauda salina]PWE18518.1 transporter [Marinicauda salina]